MLRTAIHLAAHGVALAAALFSATILATAEQSPPSAVPRAIVAPVPKPAKRPTAVDQVRATNRSPADLAAAQSARLARLARVQSWGYQLASLSLQKAQASPFDLLVVDATTGLDSGTAFTRDQVERLKTGPGGARRIVLSYLSIGEAEDYRTDYFSPEYMEEDAPDWLMKENPQWKGNRLIRFCDKGWQSTILGDENGRNVYAGDEPSPLYRLLELGFDGVYLDRVDVYAEIAKECPDGAKKMVDFVARLAEHARRKDPGFLVVLQNAEELVADPRMLDTIDGIAKESLFYGGDMGQGRNAADQTEAALRYLRMAKARGRRVFVVDYVTDHARNADAVRRISAEGFVPYIGPRNLASLWLPGVNF